MDKVECDERPNIKDIDLVEIFSELLVEDLASSLARGDKYGVCNMKENLDFGKALFYLKYGYKVARKGWNGKNMFLWLKPETTIKSEWCKDPELKKLVDENGGELKALGTICMYTHDSSGRNAVLTGWLASQSDMLLEDWYVVE